ncbi:predicted protein [Botrytis cinerea T4]|uniref:Uncharacterized protein n=1 Tax=Botryotinia fuckeliana (strain T4) TaxID=999810 RepID=G2Y369_BOTF4|nr:predicted protein [Botrytis cinerea T4]
MSIGEIDKLIEIMPQQIDQVIMRGVFGALKYAKLGSPNAFSISER